MHRFATLLLALGFGTARAGNAPDYPHPVERFAFDSQRQSLETACMEVAPEAEARGTFVPAVISQ